MTQRTKTNLVYLHDEEAGTRPVTVFRQQKLEIPQLYNDIFVVGDDYDQAMFAKMFVRAMCRKAFSIEQADIVVFTGGTDVNPAMYGAKPHSQTDEPDTLRDKVEKDIFEKCVNLGVPMVGICRGAQFGHVMNGGILYQHVDNHYGDHNMWDTVNRKYVERVSSVHHQMVVENDDMDVIGISGRSKNRYYDEETKSEGTIRDIEAFFYRDTCFFGVQGHPEYSGYDEFMIWTLKHMNELFNENPDIMLNEDGYRRVKPSIREGNKLKEMN